MLGRQQHDGPGKTGSSCSVSLSAAIQRKNDHCSEIVFLGMTLLRRLGRPLAVRNSLTAVIERFEDFLTATDVPRRAVVLWIALHDEMAFVSCSSVQGQNRNYACFAETGVIGEATSLLVWALSIELWRRRRRWRCCRLSLLSGFRSSSPRWRR